MKLTSLKIPSDVEPFVQWTLDQQQTFFGLPRFVLGRSSRSYNLWQLTNAFEPIGHVKRAIEQMYEQHPVLFGEDNTTPLVAREHLLTIARPCESNVFRTPHFLNTWAIRTHISLAGSLDMTYATSQPISVGAGDVVKIPFAHNTAAHAVGLIEEPVVHIVTYWSMPEIPKPWDLFYKQGTL